MFSLGHLTGSLSRIREGKGCPRQSWTRALMLKTYVRSARDFRSRGRSLTQFLLMRKPNRGQVVGIARHLRMSRLWAV